MNIDIYTCRYADDGMMAIERVQGGSYICKATVRGSTVKVRYSMYGKARVLALFRAYVRDSIN